VGVLKSQGHLDEARDQRRQLDERSRALELAANPERTRSSGLEDLDQMGDKDAR
jgi:hypothetical protein